MTTAADAILAAVRAAVPAGVNVYDTLVPGVPTARYVVVYVPGGTRHFNAVDGPSDEIELYFQTTTVASDANPSNSAIYCRWLAGVVRDRLTDLSITADGWAPARIRHEACQMPQPDEETPDKKVYATDQFTLETVRI